MAPPPFLRPDAPGVLVLGMHRSGTSVAAGIVERLGFQGGPRASMLAPDQFNSDGYWEQRPLVEWHDRLLDRLDGWASAPPPPPLAAEAVCRAARDLPSVVDAIPSMFRSPWFLKDPRQCLLLPAWTDRFGTDDSLVVVGRHPDGVIDSLRRRNGYSRALAVALWERYNLDLLANLHGRPCVVITYDQLLADPVATVRTIADGLARGHDRASAAALEDAAALVRGGAPPELGTPAAGVEVWEAFRARAGVHEALDASDLPAPSSASTELIERRRRRLNRVRPLVGVSSSSRAVLDRVPGRMRRLLRRDR